MPRRRAKLVGPRLPKGERAIQVEVSPEEGVHLAAHTEGVRAMWEHICSDAGAVVADPCHHAQAALYLMVPEGHPGRTVVARVHELAGVPEPDSVALSACLGDWTPESICAHVAGCTEPNPCTPIRVWWKDAPPAPSKEERQPVAVLVLPHEEQQARVMNAACGEIIRDLMRDVFAVPKMACEHLVCAVRRQYARKFPAQAENERVLLKRAGLETPDVSDPTVEVWFDRPSTDTAATEAVRAHLLSCPMTHDKSRWPLVEFVVDKNVRPVPVPTATGVKLEWNEPVWS